MIREIVDFAGPYRVRDIHAVTRGDRIDEFASVHRGGTEIGSIILSGVDTPMQISLASGERSKLDTWAHRQMKARGQPQQVESFLSLLMDYAEGIARIKRECKHAILFVAPYSSKDRWGVPTTYRRFACPNTPENFAVIRTKFPEYRFIQDELDLW